MARSVAVKAAGALRRCSTFLSPRLPALVALLLVVQAALAAAASRAAALAPAQHPPLDLRFGRFSAAQAAALMDSYSPAGRRAVAAAEIIDLAFAPIYATALAALLGACLLRIRAPPTAHLALAVPLATGAADLMENACMLAMLLGPQPVDLNLAAAAVATSRLKWACLAAAVAATLAAGCAAAARMWRGQR